MASKTGSASDGLSGFETALEAAIKADKDSPGNGLVMAAFSLGWRMADLHRRESQGQKTDDSGDLPGLGSLTSDMRREIQVDQITAGIHKFVDAIEGADLPAIDLSGITAARGNQPNGSSGSAKPASADDASEAVPQDNAQGREATPEFNAARFKKAVFDLHCDLLGELTATDARYGRAYGLGRALCDLCRKPSNDAAVISEFTPGRVATLRGWLEELTTAFPAHSAHSVSSSLNNWSAWANDAATDKTKARALARRQGELWRAILSGEKRPQDLLEISDYLDAAADAAQQAAKAVRRTVARFALLSALVIVLVLVGVGLLIVGGASTDIAGATSLLAAVGLTWKGVGTALGKLAGKLEAPMWGAVIDRAVSHAVTLIEFPKPPKQNTSIAQRTQIRFDPWTGGSSVARRGLAVEIAAASDGSDAARASNERAGSAETPTDSAATRTDDDASGSGSANESSTPT